MNSKIKLALAAASAAGAAMSLIGQVSPAFAGPQLSSTNTTQFGATADFNLSSAQSFSVTGLIDGGPATPFNSAVSGTSGTATIEGTLNAGASTLTAAFDLEGVQTGAADNGGTPSLAVQAGIVSLGGPAATTGLTTASGASALVFPLAAGIVFDRVALGAITVDGSGLDTNTIGASTANTAIGGSKAAGSITNSQTVTNGLNLTAF